MSETKITFEYKEVELNPGITGFNQPVNLVTNCVVEHNGRSHVGNAYKITSDPHCEATGRKVALTRALEDAPRSEQTEIWSIYWGMVKA